jgi:hypothetical protein
MPRSGTACRQRRVIRAKPYLEESYDIIGHNRKETERGGYIES